MRKYIAIFFATLLITPSVNNLRAAVIAPVSVAASTDPTPEEIRAKALKEFKSLSKKEKKMRLKQLNVQLKTLVAMKEQGYETDTNTLLLLILAILIPPLAVYLHQGEINTKFWIALILWLLGLGLFGILTSLAWIGILPSIIYAILVILGNA
jgi:uncharacterized membrane protein YqaE (UPF0057 family)